MFIKKIFQDKIDESVHNQFVRFSKGAYNNKAILNLQKGTKIKLKSSFEYVNDFVDFVSELGGGKVSGIVLSKENISQIMSKNNIKGNSETKKRGLFYQNSIDNQELNSDQIRELVKNSYSTLVDIEGQGFILKTKKKLPQPGKGTNIKSNDKFCVLEADLKFWPKIKEAFFWDLLECKKARIVHDYVIEEIIFPKNEKDFEKIRIMAKRKGKIIRKMTVDGKELTKEKEFVI